jgi:pimeloyl-ACP methyl ester carboxylesterase
VFVEVDGLRVNLERAGAGPPLLLLHGWGGTSRSFAPLLPALASEFSICAPDLPGFGLSSPLPETWGTADYAEFVVHLLRRLGWDRAHLLGHSYGGRISIVLAAQSPALVDHLVLVDSAGIRPPRTFSLRARGAAARTARKLLGHPIAGKAGQRALARVYGRLGMSDYSSAGELRSTFVKIVNEDLSAMLPGIAAPTLVVWGAADTETPIWMGEQMARDIPEARLVVLPDAGHYSYLDAPDLFQKHLRGFLASEPVT